MTDKKKRSISWLRENIAKSNLAPELEDTVRAEIEQRVLRGYDLDQASRREWLDRTNEGMKNALQTKEGKNFPWPNCANVRHPLIATAAIQFAARAYPSVVKGSRVVKCTVIGDDPQGQKEARAKRVSEHMSWQFLHDMTEWDAETDQLLHVLPVIGICYRKTYYDPTLRRNRSQLRSAIDVVVNNAATDLDSARRVTDQIDLYRNEVIERENAGVFSEGSSELFTGDREEDLAEEFLECHCWYDLDGDGYEEPYVVTIHKEQARMVRMVARYDEQGLVEGEGKKAGQVLRINPIQYFTKFDFIPSPDGSYHSVGFSQLVGPLNEVINTILNQLVDAGTVSNLQSGFIGKGAKLKGGTERFTPGEWKQADVPGGVLKDNIVPLPVRDPSNVLFQLLGWLTDAAHRLSSVSEIMTGDSPGQNVPATTVLAMIEQGLKVFSAIYKRVYRSLASEYLKVYRLNGIYLEDKAYYRVLDTPKAVSRADYGQTDLDVYPVADPTISSEAQKMARSQALLDTWDRIPLPEGKIEVLRRHYEALDIPEIDKILPPEAIKAFLQKGPPPNPDLIRTQLESIKQKYEHEHEAARLRAELERHAADLEKLKAEIEVLRTQAVKNIAEAEAKEAGTQFGEYAERVRMLDQHAQTAIKAQEMMNREKTLAARGNGPGSGPGGAMAGPADDTGVPPMPPGAMGAEEGEPSLGGSGGSDLGGEDGLTGELPPGEGGGFARGPQPPGEVEE